MFDRIHLTIQFILILGTLMGIQLILGKKAAFPYGLIMGLSPLEIGVLVLINDVFLIVFVRSLFDRSMRIRWLGELQQKLLIDENKLRRSKWLRYFQNLGRLGVLVVVSTPFAGGVWSGSILAHILGLKKSDSYFLIGVGSVIGCAIFVLGFYGILTWVQ